MVISAHCDVGEVLHPAAPVVSGHCVPGVLSTCHHHRGAHRVSYGTGFPKYTSCAVLFINHVHDYKYCVLYCMLNNSSVVPSHLAISEVVPEERPPRMMMPSSTSQLECWYLRCIKVWLLVHPPAVSWSQLVLVSVPPPPQTVLLFIL